MELELTIQRRRRPREDDADQLIEYLLSSLGFHQKIYRDIVKKLIHNELTSTELSQGLAKRTTTIYHLNKLMRAGIIVRKGSRYQIRDGSFERMVEELLRDVERVFEDLLWAARILDKKFGMG